MVAILGPEVAELQGGFLEEHRDVSVGCGALLGASDVLGGLLQEGSLS